MAALRVSAALRHTVNVFNKCCLIVASVCVTSILPVYVSDYCSLHFSGTDQIRRKLYIMEAKLLTSVYGANVI